jgi:hypothetical protein
MDSKTTEKEAPAPQKAPAPPDPGPTPDIRPDIVIPPAPCYCCPDIRRWTP